MFNKQKKKISGILLNFMLKTADVYIWNAISKGLGIQTCRISTTVWPVNIAIPPAVKKFGEEENSTSHEHLEPNWQNKIKLSRYLDKMIVHVREPCMATLKFTYHINQEQRNMYYPLKDKPEFEE